MDVPIQSLQPGMTIVAYTGFDRRYTPLDEKTCEWVRHNFKGATVKGRRGNAEFSKIADELEAGDQILEIKDFPVTLQHICRVTPGLLRELEARGFLRFRALPPAEAPADAPASRAARVAEASRLLENIRENLDLCLHATTAVESLLDGARESAPNFKEVQDFADRLTSDETVKAISAIVSLKENDHVYAHSVDVGVIFQQTYFAILEKTGEQSAFRDQQEAMLGAFLHDIGKARIPKEIINSKQLFKPDSPEMLEIRKHPVIGAQLLQDAGMPEVMINMARHHHVKLDETMTSSYPQGVRQDETMFETRLLSIVDTYQALVAGRSYKKSWTPSAVMRYLDAIAGIEFDVRLWERFREVMGYFPIGSLVKLSDDSLAFVISVPQKDLLNPQVAVVMAPDGRRTEKNRLIDLAEEEGLSIQKDIDAAEVFSEKAFTVFSGLQIV